MVTYKTITDGKEHMEIIEDSTKKITKVYDDKYRIKDFFKPSLLEVVVGVLEIPLVSLPTFAITQMSTQNPVKAVAYALVPQVLTYVGARAVELFKRDRIGLLGHTAQTIRDTKMTNPYSRIKEEIIVYK